MNFAEKENNVVRFLAIIPARGGSKGVKGKNLRPLAGKPLLAWTIDAALHSKHISTTIVSTDDREIADVAMKYGAQVPFMRPADIAGDTSPTIAAIFHAIEFFGRKGKHFEYVVCLQCTSPLRTSWHIDKAIEAGLKMNANCIVSVCEAEHSPFWMGTIDREANLKLLFEKESQGARRQDLPKVYRLNGAFYMARIPYLIDRKSWLTEYTKVYVMSQESSVDIDTELDFAIAEAIIHRNAAE